MIKYELLDNDCLGNKFVIYDRDTKTAYCKTAQHHISATVIADSVNAMTGNRLISVQITLPRMILAEYNTHKLHVKNFSSSRAIPSKQLRASVWNDPFVPVVWGSNQRGMVAGSELTGFRRWLARTAWTGLSKVAVFSHWCMEKAGLHKQTCNRILEPWLSVTGITTASNWSNFFKLRCSNDAQPEMQVLACCIKEAIKHSNPVVLPTGQAHLPYVTEGESKNNPIDICAKISVARCCRASYLKLGKPSNLEDDVRLFNTLKDNGHLSPFEHVAFSGSNKPEDYAGLVKYLKLPDNAVNSAYFYRNFVGDKGTVADNSGWIMFRSLVDPDPKLPVEGIIGVIADMKTESHESFRDLLKTVFDNVK